MYWIIFDLLNIDNNPESPSPPSSPPNNEAHDSGQYLFLAQYIVYCIHVHDCMLIYYALDTFLSSKYR